LLYLPSSQHREAHPEGHRAPFVALRGACASTAATWRGSGEWGRECGRMGPTALRWLAFDAPPQSLHPGAALTRYPTKARHRFPEGRPPPRLPPDDGAPALGFGPPPAPPPSTSQRKRPVAVFRFLSDGGTPRPSRRSANRGPAIFPKSPAAGGHLAAVRAPAGRWRGCDAALMPRAVP